MTIVEQVLSSLLGCHDIISAAADHAIVEGHQLDWKSAKVIDREKRWRSRKVKEALWSGARTPLWTETRDGT